MVKVLLLNPFVLKMHGELSFAENFRPPLGLAYVGSALEAAGYEVEIHDALLLGTRFPRLRKLLRRSRPDAVGISVYTPTRFEAFLTAQLVRETLGASVPIIAGGPHVSAAPEDTLENVPAIDHVVAGEGERPLVELLEVLSGGGDPTSVAGVFSRRDGEVVCGSPRSVPIEIDEIPRPGRHLLPMKRYGTRMPSTMHSCTTVLTSRGCPARCLFCGRDWLSSEPRLHSPEYVVDEIEEVLGRWKTRAIIFQDDTFTMNKKRTREICELIRARGLRFKWLATTRVDCLSLELLREMKATGCEVITFGAESMNPKTLKWLRKGFTVEQVRRAVGWANELELIVRCSYLMGVGDERAEDLHRSVRLARELRVNKLKANVGLSIYPGTPVLPLAVEAGVLPADFSFAAGWRDPANRYGYGETPRWYTPHVPLERLKELRRETEVNALFTRSSFEVWRHRARKLVRRLRKHPGETTKHLARFGLAAVGGSRFRRRGELPGTEATR